MLWYNRKPNYLLKNYVNTVSNFHNLSHPLDRIIFTSKCLGYLDGLFNARRVQLKEYKYYQNKLYEILENKQGIEIMPYGHLYKKENKEVIKKENNKELINKTSNRNNKKEIKKSVRGNNK